MSGRIPRRDAATARRHQALNLIEKRGSDLQTALYLDGSAVCCVERVRGACEIECSAQFAVYLSCRREAGRFGGERSISLLDVCHERRNLCGCCANVGRES